MRTNHDAVVSTLALSVGTLGDTDVVQCGAESGIHLAGRPKDGGQLPLVHPFEHLRVDHRGEPLQVSTPDDSETCGVQFGSRLVGPLTELLLLASSFMTDSGTVIATIVAAGIVALATIVGAAYASWRSEIRRIQAELYLDLLPKLSDSYPLAHEIDSRLTRRIARRAILAGGKLRQYGEEMYDYAWMAEHIMDPILEGRFPAFYTGSPQERQAWILTEVDTRRARMATLLAFQLQRLTWRAARWPCHWYRRVRERRRTRTERAARSEWVRV